MANLSDIQRILLSAATQRADGSLLPAPDTLTNVGARITKALAALVKRELAEERDTNDAASVVRDDGHRCCQSNANRSPHDAPGSLKVAA